MVGTTEEEEKGLYLRRYRVPDEGIAQVLGHSAMYWYRATPALGRPSIVGSRVKNPEAIPPSSYRRCKTNLVVGKTDLRGSDGCCGVFSGGRDCPLC
jgi:hypothetical protein